MDDAMNLIIDIWNSLSPEGRKLWIGEGQVLPCLLYTSDAADD